MSGDAAVAALGVVVALTAGGIASGLVPVINAEALLALATARDPQLWLLLAVAITVGQSAAKVVIYLTARDVPRRIRGDGPLGRMAAWVQSRVRRRVASARTPTGRVRFHRERLMGQLAAPVTGTGLVALSASAGFPPLAVVSALAGMARLRLRLFVAACLAGRLLRFVVIAWPVAQLVRTTG